MLKEGSYMTILFSMERTDNNCKEYDFLKSA